MPKGILCYTFNPQTHTHTDNQLFYAFRISEYGSVQNGMQLEITLERETLRSTVRTVNG